MDDRVRRTQLGGGVPSIPQLTDFRATLSSTGPTRPRRQRSSPAMGDFSLPANLN
jgi:hypothetical protein